MKDMIRRVARRELDRHGQSVDLIHKEQTGSDEYGETYDETVETTPARISVAGHPRADGSLRDAGDVEADVNVYVKDTVNSLVSGGGRGATHVDEDQDGDPEYRVLWIEDQDNGLFRLACERL